MSPSEDRAENAKDPEFDEVQQVEGVVHGALRLEDLKHVRISVAADLGQTSMTVRQVLELKEGSVIPLDKMAGEMTDIYGNGMLIGHGEVVVIGDELHVRISEIAGEDDVQGIYSVPDES